MTLGDLGIGGVDVSDVRPRRHVVDDPIEDGAGGLVIGAVLEPEELDFVRHGRLSVR